MTTRKYLVLLTLAFTFICSTAQAQESEDPTPNEGAAPGEQRPDRQHKRTRRENMTEEQRAAARERWQNMSDEERQAKREKMRTRRGGKDGHRRGGARNGQRPDTS
ncbi:MAG: hypothetical protein ACR2QS_09660 [Woeseiaceae bacterium]